MKTSQFSTNHDIILPLESMETEKLFSILNSKPTKMSVIPFCVWAVLSISANICLSSRLRLN